MAEPRQSPGWLALEALAHGKRHDLRLPVDVGGPSPVSIPVYVLAGRHHRPCLALVAGVHGDEYDGILALQALVREVSPEGLEGSLLVIPVTNPPAFAAASRQAPQDDRDLNRVFPGRPEGTLSERLAHALCTDILAEADLVFTLHGARSTGILLPWIEFLDTSGNVGARSFEAAHASGFRDLMALPPLPGRLITALAERGIPLIEGEVGGRGEAADANIAFYRARIDAVARHIGVRTTPQTPLPADPAPRVWHLHSISAGAPGIFLSEVELGLPVRTGDVLGRIVTITGDLGAVIQAPCDGVIGGLRTHAGVAPEDDVLSMWSAAGALRAPRVRDRDGLAAPEGSDKT